MASLFVGHAAQKSKLHNLQYDEGGNHMAETETETQALGYTLWCSLFSLKLNIFPFSASILTFSTQNHLILKYFTNFDTPVLILSIVINIFYLVFSNGLNRIIWHIFMSNIDLWKITLMWHFKTISIKERQFSYWLYQVTTRKCL